MVHAHRKRWEALPRTSTYTLPPQAFSANVSSLHGVSLATDLGIRSLLVPHSYRRRLLYVPLPRFSVTVRSFHIPELFFWSLYVFSYVVTATGEFPPVRWVYRDPTQGPHANWTLLMAKTSDAVQRLLPTCWTPIPRGCTGVRLTIDPPAQFPNCDSRVGARCRNPGFCAQIKNTFNGSVLSGCWFLINALRLDVPRLPILPENFPDPRIIDCDPQTVGDVTP